MVDSLRTRPLTRPVPQSQPRSGEPAPSEVTVEELRRAWVAVRDGCFRDPGHPVDRIIHLASTPTSRPQWCASAGELVIPVVGTAGSVGATTVALALATAAAQRAGPTTAAAAGEERVRVIECANAHRSGLAAASDAELGTDGDGWRHGRRAGVRLQRRCGELCVDNVLPTPGPGTDLWVTTVLDAGSEAESLIDGNGWLSEQVVGSPHLVIAAVATVPGLRRLEGVLELLAVAATPREGVVALLGPPRRRWPARLRGAPGRRTRELLDSPDAIVPIPEDRSLRVSGLETSPLPPAVLTAAERVLTRVAGEPDQATQPARSTAPSPEET